MHLLVRLLIISYHLLLRLPESRESVFWICLRWLRF